MANIDVRGNPYGFADKRKGRGSDTSVVAEHANLKDVASMRARLTALDANYTAARLDKMTINDMVYAIRVKSADAAGI